MNKKSLTVFAKTALLFPWVISLGLHSLIVLALLLTVRCDSNTTALPQTTVKSIKAVVINEKHIRAEKEKIRQQQLAKQRKEQQRQERIRQKEREKKRLAKQKRLEAKKKNDAQKKKKRDDDRAKKARDKANAKKERKKALQDRAKKKRDKEQREQKRLADQRDEANAQAEADFRDKMLKEQQAEERRMSNELMENEQTNINQANNAQRQTIITKYTGRLRDKITRYWIRPKNTPAGLSCTLEVHLIPGGDVLNVKIIRSSGNAIFDRSAKNAVYKAEPLPIPDDITLFSEFKTITYNFNPDE